MKNILIFDISKLMERGTGTRDIYSFEGLVSLEGLKFKKAIKGKVEIMKIEEGFNVKVSDFEAKIEMTCDKCLALYGENIKVDFAERIYFLNRPSETIDPEDLFLVDKKHLSVDISEMIRQEIILHFPITPVCSKSCKGLCEIYCKEEGIHYQPFAKLKELLK
ncbi:MAG: DUF177 domain-containing protein [Candidatus Gracilibacteria bacterium]|nr:DUF177 domain-containing protein [Candidatus Gracilibacteria bacterium]